MNKIFILAEHKKGHLKKATSELLAACQGKEVSAVIFGSEAEVAAQELATKGVKQVFWVKDTVWDHYHSEAWTHTVEDLIKQTQPSLFLGSASSLGKDLIPRLAARFESTLASDCIQLEWDPFRVRRPFYSGKALAWIEFEKKDLLFVTLRPNSLPEGQISSQKGQVIEYKPHFNFSASPIQFLKKTAAASDRPDLTEANIIVSGGRSLKSKENFKILFELSDVLGAAVGASRAAVDEGYANHDMQVGQTGKTVNPSLYIACGISGAIQHLAGMRTSKVIVVINKDPAAPLFQKADYGIGGDLFEIVPLLTKEFKKLLNRA